MFVFCVFCVCSRVSATFDLKCGSDVVISMSCVSVCLCLSVSVSVCLCACVCLQVATLSLNPRLTKVE